MASSADFKNLFDKYQMEGAPHGISIVKYCQMNGVVYSHFERWYKKYRAGVVFPVHVVDQDGLMEEATPRLEAPQIDIAHLTLIFSNGIEVTHHNLNYPALRQMIVKLEALC